MSSEAKGLLSSLEGLPIYHEEHEKFLASLKLTSLDSQIASAPRGLFGLSWQAKDLMFQKKLVQFALDRRIPLGNIHWEDSALRAAAKEHPDLQIAAKKGRGRPSHRQTGGLLSLFGPNNTDEEAQEIVKEIDEINRVRLAEGKKEWSDRFVAKALVSKREGCDESNQHFASRVQVWQNRLSDTRTALGMNKRPKKKSVTK